VRAALGEGGRPVGVSEPPQLGDPQERPAEHAHVDVRSAAGSAAQAHEIASELHDRALQRVLATAQARQGWTSSFAQPELAASPTDAP
jgi:hypothetical protein